MKDRDTALAFPEDLTLDDVELFLSHHTLPPGISPQVREYVLTLQEVSRLIEGGKTPEQISNHLVLTRGITRRKATAIYTEAFNYYNISEELHPAAVRAYFANIMQRINSAILRSHPSHDILINVRDSYLRIADLMGANREEKDDAELRLIPETVVYTMKYGDFGLGGEAEKLRLLIDRLPVSQGHKTRLLSEAGMGPDGTPVIKIDDND